MMLKQKFSNVLESLSHANVQGDVTVAGKSAEKSSEVEKKTSKL